MENKTVVILLTTDVPFNLDTLPYAENRLIIQCGFSVEHLTLTGLRGHMEYILKDIGRELRIQDKVFIVMLPTARAFAAAWMLTTAFQMITIEPEVWIIEGTGIYVGIREFLATGKNWANELLESWRQKAAEEQFKEVMLTEEEKSVLKKSE